MITNSYRTVEKTVEELTRTSVFCDGCKREFVLFELNNQMSLRTLHTDYVSVICNIPTGQYNKHDTIEKHYCLDCWGDIRDTIFA